MRNISQNTVSHLILLQKEREENAMNFVIIIKKDWFSHETGVVFVHDEVCKGSTKNFATFRMELSVTASKG